MKIIISQDQIDKMKSLIDKVGIESLGIDSYRLVEMGFIQKYDGSLNLRDTPIKSLGNLEYVGNDLILTNKILDINEIDNLINQYNININLQNKKLMILSSAFGKIQISIENNNNNNKKGYYHTI